MIMLALIAGMVGCGLSSQNVKIRTWYDLDAIRNNLGGSYLLMNDLDSTTAGYEELASLTANGGKGWQPIGTQNDTFTGIFDGQEYEIRDLFSNRPDENYVGLFGIVYTGGGIEDIGVVNVNVTGNSSVGGLVGVNLGTVSNSYSSSNVNGESAEVGGLVGLNGGTVSNSHSSGSVTGQGHVGGLVGGNGATVSNSYSTSNVTGYYAVGGLVGASSGTANNSYSTGNVTGYQWVGGLVGGNAGTVSNSYSTGSATGNSSVGGLVGDNSGTVSGSFWDTETSGQATSDGGTGKNTTEMKDIATFSGAAWNITAVALNQTNPSYVWNIVNGVAYPLLSWQPV